MKVRMYVDIFDGMNPSWITATSQYSSSTVGKKFAFDLVIPDHLLRPVSGELEVQGVELIGVEDKQND